MKNIRAGGFRLLLMPGRQRFSPASVSVHPAADPSGAGTPSALLPPQRRQPIFPGTVKACEAEKASCFNTAERLFLMQPHRTGDYIYFYRLRLNRGKDRPAVDGQRRPVYSASGSAAGRCSRAARGGFTPDPQTRRWLALHFPAWPFPHPAAHRGTGHSSCRRSPLRPPSPCRCNNSPSARPGV